MLNVVRDVPELEVRAKLRVVIINIIKIAMIVGLLYIFVCSLDLLASSFRLISARQAGNDRMMFFYRD